MPKRGRVCALQRRTAEWRCDLTLRIHCENVWVAVRDICRSCIRDRAVMCRRGLRMWWILATCGWVRCECDHAATSRLDRFGWNKIVMQYTLDHNVRRTVVQLIYASSSVYLNYISKGCVTLAPGLQTLSSFESLSFTSYHFLFFIVGWFH